VGDVWTGEGFLGPISHHFILCIWSICRWLGSLKDRKVSKHEQRQGDPPEPKSVVRHERIGGRTAAGDGVGGMQRITPWAMKIFPSKISPEKG
jgi:hypothetical protein